MSMDTQTSPEARMPEVTEVGEFDKETEGYIVIAPLPENVKDYIASIQKHLTDEIPESNLWLPSGEQLHITFAHVVSPDADYDTPRGTVFKAVRDDAEIAVEHAANNVRGTHVRFTAIKAFPGAIILTGEDDGTIAAARAKFTEELTAPEGTRTPPNIIHITIARFREPISMDDVRRAAGSVHPDLSFEIPSLQLINEHMMYTQSHDVLKEF